MFKPRIIGLLLLNSAAFIHTLPILHPDSGVRVGDEVLRSAANDPGGFSASEDASGKIPTARQEGLLDSAMATETLNPATHSQLHEENRRPSDFSRSAIHDDTYTGSRGQASKSAATDSGEGVKEKALKLYSEFQLQEEKNDRDRQWALQYFRSQHASQPPSTPELQNRFVHCLEFLKDACVDALQAVAGWLSRRAMTEHHRKYLLYTSGLHASIEGGKYKSAFDMLQTIHNLRMQEVNQQHRLQVIEQEGRDLESNEVSGFGDQGPAVEAESSRGSAQVRQRSLPVFQASSQPNLPSFTGARRRNARRAETQESKEVLN